ncbi:hypothetical protein C8Q77DRAFT_138171 [Trametes polyzona]|nr:hypothetical protein C8Q77DRAFT_138171 [Trametes polyzona]
MSVDERTLLLDENLPGPLYSLPPVRSGLPRPSAYPCPPEENLNSHRQPSELELLSYKALWNADRPIHILPPELLIEIFTYLLWPDTGSRRPWTRLMCVCRHCFRYAAPERLSFVSTSQASAAWRRPLLLSSRTRITYGSSTFASHLLRPRPYSNRSSRRRSLTFTTSNTRVLSWLPPSIAVPSNARHG